MQKQDAQKKPVIPVMIKLSEIEGSKPLLAMKLSYIKKR